MKASLKGALLSGLVFPGMGQIALKRYKRGIALILATMIGMIAMIAKGVQIALGTLDKLAADGGVIDMNTMTAATRAVTASDSLILNGAFFLIVTCWIFGIIDAYFIGRKKDNKLQ